MSCPRRRGTCDRLRKYHSRHSWTAASSHCSCSGTAAAAAAWSFLSSEQTQRPGINENDYGHQKIVLRGQAAPTIRPPGPSAHAQPPAGPAGPRNPAAGLAYTTESTEIDIARSLPACGATLPRLLAGLAASRIQGAHEPVAPAAASSASSSRAAGARMAGKGTRRRRHATGPSRARADGGVAGCPHCVGRPLGGGAGQCAGPSWRSRR